MSRMILLGSGYSDEANKVTLSFLNIDTNEMYVYTDRTGYRPCCLTSVPVDKFYQFCYESAYQGQNLKGKGVEEVDEGASEEEEWDRIEKSMGDQKKRKPIKFAGLAVDEVERYNSLKFKTQKYTKVYGRGRLDIIDYRNKGGVNIKGVLSKAENGKTVYDYCYEDIRDIPVNQSYVMDYKLAYGMTYTIDRCQMSIRQPKPCQHCGGVMGVYTYYVSDEDETDIRLGVVECESCGKKIEKRAESTGSGRSKIFQVSREFDYETVSKSVFFPVLVNEDIDAEVVKSVVNSFRNERDGEKRLVHEWMPYFFNKVPTNIERVAMDIEVYVPKKGLFPEVDLAKFPISAVVFEHYSGKKTAFLLKVWGEKGDLFPDMPSDIEVFVFKKDDEDEMMRQVFKYMEKCPIIITHNGNNFDLPYMGERAKNLGIEQVEIPFTYRRSRSKGFQIKFNCDMKYNFHIDTFNFFGNRALRAYAFGGKYNSLKLRDITKVLLKNMTKVDVEIKTNRGLAVCENIECKEMPKYSTEDGRNWDRVVSKSAPTSDSGGDDEDGDDTSYIKAKGGDFLACPFCGEKMTVNFDVKEIFEYTKNELLYYCYNDVKITLELTRFDDCISITLMFLLMRLAKVGLEDLCNHQIGFWLKNFMFYEMRAGNFLEKPTPILIPLPSEIRSITRAYTSAMIDGKKFQGAYVVEPKAGIHFNVTATDFASLYPSIIKTKNLSYETVDNCDHPECKSNTIADTPHWVCTKFDGIVSIVIGAVRDVRVLHFKQARIDNDALIKAMKKEGKDDDVVRLMKFGALLKVIESVLKVFINAGYGVFASPTFYLFQIGMSECVTAEGRSNIKKVIDFAEKTVGVEVIYGDTDSIFIKDATEEQINVIIDWVDKNINIPMAIDYVFKFMASSRRKKNYVGFYKQNKDKSGSIIKYDDPTWKQPSLKGVTGKKSNTPAFIKERFNKVIKMLDIEVNSESDIDKTIKKMKRELKDVVKRVLNEKILLKDMAISQKLSKWVLEYGNEETKRYNRKLVESAKKSDKGNKKKSNFLENGGGDSGSTHLVDAYGKFNTKGFNQNAKCALMLLQHGYDVETGDIIRFVKTKHNKSLPIEIINNWNDVDKAKYIQEVSSVFKQLYDCFGIDTDSTVSIAKDGSAPQSIDKFFGVKPAEAKEEEDTNEDEGDGDDEGDGGYFDEEPEDDGE